MGLDLETFPLEWNLSRLEEGGRVPGGDDLKLLSLARAHLATTAGISLRAGNLLEGCRAWWPEDPLVWRSSLELAVAAGRPRDGSRGPETT